MLDQPGVLVRNGAVPRRGHTLQVQLLCSGETKIAVEVYPPRVMQMKYEKKCPIVVPSGTRAKKVDVYREMHDLYGASEFGVKAQKVSLGML